MLFALATVIPGIINFYLVVVCAGHRMKLMLNGGQCAFGEFLRRAEEGDLAIFQQQHLRRLRGITCHNGRIPLLVLLRAVARQVRNLVQRLGGQQRRDAMQIARG